MPFTILESGSRNGDVMPPNATRFARIGGWAWPFETTEVNSQTHIYDTLTWANMIVRVIVNDAAANTTITGRVNAADGNQSIVVASGLLGEFEDTTNSDALVDGDLINYQLVRTAGGANWRISIWGTTFENADNGINYMIGRNITMSSASGVRFSPVINDSIVTLTEAQTPVTIRFACTLDRLRLFFLTNTLNGAITAISRVNGANGNLTITIAAGLTGEFEDTVNSDTLVAGDTFNLQWSEAAGAGTSNFHHQLRLIGSDSDAYLRSHVASDAINDNDNRFTMMEGTGNGGTEESSQMTLRATSITVNNMFLMVITNTITVTTTFVNRINGADGSMSIAVAATLTGYFEDTGNTDTIEVGDNGDLNESAPLGAGSLNFTLFGLQMAELAAAFNTARKYPNPDSIEVADRFASSGIKYPIPITLLTVQRFRNSARKYPRPST